MKAQYEKLFNSPGSRLRVDEAWLKYHRKGGVINPRYLYALKFMKGNVLELGGGDGFFTHLLAKREEVQHVTSVEIQDKALVQMKLNLKPFPELRDKITICKGAIETTDFRPRFDSVHCGHTLEHVIDLEKSLARIWELKSEVVVIAVPIFGGVNRQHRREWTDVDAFRDLMKEYFEEIEYSQFHDPAGTRKSSLVIVLKSKT